MCERQPETPALAPGLVHSDGDRHLDRKRFGLDAGVVEAHREGRAGPELLQRGGEPLAEGGGVAAHPNEMDLRRRGAADQRGEAAIPN